MAMFSRSHARVPSPTKHTTHDMSARLKRTRQGKMEGDEISSRIKKRKNPRLSSLGLKLAELGGYATDDWCASQNHSAYGLPLMG
jgi:hypothetical protein